MRPILEQALSVVAALPLPEPEQRTVLAARLLDGDPHALDPGTPLHGVMISLLSAQSEFESEVGVREVWRHFGVVVDPVSSNVLALGLRLTGSGIAARIVDAVAGGHVILTYAQLTAGDFVWPSGLPCFSCENPSVVIAAEQRLGTDCPPLICTGGHPSDAARVLLSAAAASGEEIRHHSDFDASGLSIFLDLERRYGAVPWRFDVREIQRLSARLGMQPSPAGVSLSAAIGQLPRPQFEEEALDDLILDLRNAK